MCDLPVTLDKKEKKKSPQAVQTYPRFTNGNYLSEISGRNMEESKKGKEKKKKRKEKAKPFL